MTPLDRLRADHDAGLLTGDLLVASTPAPNLDHLQEKILLLDKEIDAEHARAGHSERSRVLCAMFQTLMWARAPNNFGFPDLP